MQFDLFHSIGRIDTVLPVPSDTKIFREFIKQCREGEEMGFKTMWVAESHFSSEIQKAHKEAVIPNYHGEVGLNADSCQMAHHIFNHTKKIGFGTAILNIVGGNGGPIASADRIRSLIFYNSMQDVPRKLNIGFASGRFPYINKPFGIVPRNSTEEILWPQVQRLIFLEATEIFLRLLNGETLSSQQTQTWSFDKTLFKDQASFDAAMEKLRKAGQDLNKLAYEKRWLFDTLQLVPHLSPSSSSQFLNFVLGSHDPMARDHALKFADVDIFNLSFTPPDQLNKIHEEMHVRYQSSGKTWKRSRMPRTVLTFIDKSSKKALERASQCFDTYIEAMKGTVVLPPKEELMSRALIGDSAQIRDQLSEGSSHGFHSDDRLMLWFEFNQVDHSSILEQMNLFSKEIAPFFTH